jgi:hypothetical protein
MVSPRIRGKREGFDQDEGCLEIRRRAEWEALLAVIALPGGDLG